MGEEKVLRKKEEDEEEAGKEGMGEGGVLWALEVAVDGRRLGEDLDCEWSAERQAGPGLGVGARPASTNQKVPAKMVPAVGGRRGKDGWAGAEKTRLRRPRRGQRAGLRRAASASAACTEPSFVPSTHTQVRLSFVRDSKPATWKYCCEMSKDAVQQRIRKSNAASKLAVAAQRRGNAKRAGEKQRTMTQ